MTTRPAATDATQGLPRKAVNATELKDGDSRCMVCHESWEADVRVAEMPCSHIFHEPCIDRPLTGKNMCPTCHFELPAAEDTGASQETAGEMGHDVQAGEASPASVDETDDCIQIGATPPTDQSVVLEPVGVAANEQEEGPN